MFTDGYGLIVDYLAEVLKAFRSEDFSNEFSPYFSLDETIATRRASKTVGHYQIVDADLLLKFVETINHRVVL